MPYTIAQVSEMTHLSKHTIRYYDKEGLLPFVERTEGGIRRFSEGDLEWLRLICCLKNTGMHIRDIRTFIGWSMQGDPDRRKRVDILIRQRDQVKRQMEELQKNLEKIEGKIRYFSSCASCNTQDEATLS